MVEVLAGAVVVAVGGAVLLPNNPPAPRDGVVVAAAVEVVEAGAVAVLPNRPWEGAAEVVDVVAPGLSAPAAVAVLKKLGAVAVVVEGVAAALEPPKRFEVDAAVVVGVEAVEVEAGPNMGFCAAAPAPPKRGAVVAAVVGATVDAGVLWVPPKKFGLAVVGVDATVVPPPNKPPVAVVAGAVVVGVGVPNRVPAGFVSAGLGAPPKRGDGAAAPAVLFPKSPVAGVEPAFAVENKPPADCGVVVAILSAACAAPNNGTAGFAASPVGVAGLSPPATLPNNPPVVAAGLLPKLNPEAGADAGGFPAGVVGGFPKRVDPPAAPPNIPEPPVVPLGAPKGEFVAPAVGVEA